VRARFRLTKVDFSTLRKIFSHFGVHLRKHWSNLALSILSLFGVSLVTLGGPWPLKIVFDYLIVPKYGHSKTAFLEPLRNLEPVSILAIAAGGVLILAILKGLFNYSQVILTKTVGIKLVAAIRVQLFSHVQRLPQSYHDYRETGELMARMTGDISLLQDLLVSSVITIISRLILLLSMLSILFWMDWELALIAIGLLPFFVLAAFRFSGKINRSARAQREAYGRIVANVQETFSGISQVKSFAQENRRTRLIGKSVAQDTSANVKTARLTANYARIVELINAVGLCLVLWFGAMKALNGQISAGDLLVFMSYLRGMFRPIKDIARLTGKVAKATVRGEKIIELLELKPEVEESDEGISAKEIQGDIRFENVSFSYVSGWDVLHDFSCRIPKHKTTLVIGPTGAGKSTLAKLLLRLYKPSQGDIFIDDRKIEVFDVRSLRKRMTPLAQETFLFRTSVAENIAFTKNKASRDEIERAARVSGAHEFICLLPEGYDTLVGEGGLTLSGGQRQLISFARAALRQSPIMIFDEPATGLDSYAESETLRVLGTLKNERTLLIITHRLHFLKLSDWVVFIRDGRMVEEGTLDDLMAVKGAFYDFRSNAQESVSLESTASVSGTGDQQ